MRYPYRTLFLLILAAAVLLSACDQLLDLLPSGEELEDLSAEEDIGPQATARAGEGTATVYYHYYIKSDPVKFKIDATIPLSMGEGDQMGSWDVNGIGQTRVLLEMEAQEESGICLVQCDMYVLLAADGEITLDDNTGECVIPLKFQVSPQEDESIITGTCPDEFLAMLSCPAYIPVMIDPSLYTFTRTKRDVTQPTDPVVTLKAEIRDVSLPPGAASVCNW